ncbi:MBL fold metallo-hydrolase [Candidatus Nomurabacteria bacterium]|nr:MBL fold metallo-hydrolase [Candidatus Nomurabacteria bacterium]
MVISHFGLGMVKVQLGDRVIVFNPIGKGADIEPTKFGADLALVSLRDSAYNGVEQVSRGDRVPFVIDSPGEYEIAGDFVQGFSTSGPSEKINVAYLLVLDGVRLAHLGALAKPELPDSVVETLGKIDVIFLPISDDLLGPKGANKLATLLEPRVVVPVNFDAKGLAAFLKDMGETVEPIDSWTMKRKDLVDKEGEVVVIKSF